MRLRYAGGTNRYCPANTARGATGRCSEVPLESAVIIIIACEPSTVLDFYFH